MVDFATASMIQRRQILEDALADVLRGCGEICCNLDGERCLALARQHESDTWDLHSLYDLACQLEVKLA